MGTRLRLEILRQPDQSTCGPTCLHAVYAYYGDHVDLAQLVTEVPSLESGGTLAVLLGCHALRRGYQARIYTYNLQLFDPTWFLRQGVDVTERLARQAEWKTDDERLQVSTVAYTEFLARGGEIVFEDLTPALIRRHLRRDEPLIAGISATYLHRSIREYGPKDEDDDVRGHPTGHFVVLSGYTRGARHAIVADPLQPHSLLPGEGDRLYHVSLDRLICAILLGVLTYDANLLVVRPRNPGDTDAGAHRSQ